MVHLLEIPVKSYSEIIVLICACLAACRAGGTLGDREKLSSSVEVVDSADGRRFIINGLVRDVVDTLTWKSRSRYAAVMELPSQFFERPGQALLIGMGSGSILRNYAARGWKVEVAEPDTGILHGAKRFKIPPSEIFEADGREILEKNSMKYDIILVDGISTGKLPGHLLTEEFFSLVLPRLSPRGIFAVAFESVGWKDLLVTSIGATMKQIFTDVMVLPIAEPPNQFGSIVVMARTFGGDILHDPDRNTTFDPEWRYGTEYQKTHAWDNQFVPNFDEGRILTDRYRRSDPMLTRGADSARGQSDYYIP